MVWYSYSVFSIVLCYCPCWGGRAFGNDRHACGNAVSCASAWVVSGLSPKVCWSMLNFLANCVTCGAYCCTPDTLPRAVRYQYNTNAREVWNGILAHRKQRIISGSITIGAFRGWDHCSRPYSSEQYQKKSPSLEV